MQPPKKTVLYHENGDVTNHRNQKSPPIIYQYRKFFAIFPQYMESHKIHVPNHQPAINLDNVGRTIINHPNLLPKLIINQQG